MEADPPTIPDTANDYTRRALARCIAKLAAQTDPERRRYYELCIAGHQRNIKREKENGA